jgi:tRNA(Ile)-lysidine synthase
MTAEAGPILNLQPGRWCVAVSGGADSVALLRLLHARRELHLHVAHLDHQLRGPDSTADARFVAALSAMLNIPATIATLSDIAPALSNPPANPSALYRAARFDLFARVVLDHQLDGVVLAHHADDQAETILHRLIRSASIEGLHGMRPVTTIATLQVHRPLLSIRRQTLRNYLHAIGQSWREDSSNASHDYLRNRLRDMLRVRPHLIDTLLALGRAAESLAQWVADVAPTTQALSSEMSVHVLTSVPAPIAREIARRWLLHHGAPSQAVDGRSIQRLLDMAADASTAARQEFPGGIRIARRSGLLRRVQPQDA